MAHDVALVTGAAGGIGQAVASALARQGSAVGLLDLPGSGLDGVAAGLEWNGRTGVAVEADVRRPDEVAAAVRSVEARLGAITQLACVAGVLRPGGVLSTTDADWAEQFAVNSTGVFHCLRAVGRLMAGRRAGAIVVVTSNAAVVPRQNMLGYAASKAASTALTRCAGLELAGYGVRCNTILPGSTDTPMQRALWPDPVTGTRAALDGDPGAYRVGVPLRRIAAPDDVAEMAAFLLSERARHVTLQTVAVDGGASL
ncbi:SDR family oxidoreductase [Phytohabitans sp. ZYX-F-186]|uniref:SDR family oxidoreductase n=1 Tax=Phytohabitans maris TaxID=3071409 RepID=A0ABU0Z939_9ACTN|nr:SDR family oxidoreductase [Phytohabitans sp. ZYX-F-186]MDQ7903573.1 SDR family oxidoreductase [Phytohabitans sp. ZYX-F-186]